MSGLRSYSVAASEAQQRIEDEGWKRKSFGPRKHHVTTPDAIQGSMINRAKPSSSVGQVLFITDEQRLNMLFAIGITQTFPGDWEMIEYFSGSLRDPSMVAKAATEASIELIKGLISLRVILGTEPKHQSWASAFQSEGFASRQVFNSAELWHLDVKASHHA